MKETFESCVEDIEAERDRRNHYRRPENTLEHFAAILRQFKKEIEMDILPVVTQAAGLIRSQRKQISDLQAQLATLTTSDAALATKEASESKEISDLSAQLTDLQSAVDGDQTTPTTTPAS